MRASQVVKDYAVGLFEGKGVGPVGHQGGQKVMDEVRGHAVHPFPNRVRDRVGPWGRRRGGAGKGPANLVRCQREAFSEREQDGVGEPSWIA